jgi:PAS domain S-box-containing protein
MPETTGAGVRQGLLRVEHAVALTRAETASSAAIYPNVLAAIGTTLGWPIGAVWEMAASGEALHCVEVWESADEQATTEFRALSEHLTLASGEGLPGRVWLSGEPVWFADVPAVPNFPRAAAAAAAGLRAAFGFPIKSGGTFLGAMEFFTRDARAPDELLLASAAILGSQIGQFVVRRKAEDAVAESEARNRAILDSALDAVITMNHRGEVLEFNRAAERVFGYTRQDVLGREMAELIVPPSLRERHRRGLARYLETDAATVLDTRLEIVALHADGREFPVELTITRIELPGPATFTGYVRDITERRRAEKELKESRARIVEAADEERRRIELNLHDGAQQQLVSLALKLRNAVESLDDEPSVARTLLEQADLELAVAIDELRELAHGIHPAVLSERGLRPAVEGLAARSPLAVRIEELPGDRLPAFVEVAAYYIVAEALTNAIKHARADRASVRVAAEDDVAVVEVVDNGIGGAAVESGSGLLGLADRVSALGGQLSIDSPPGAGTRVRAEIPLMSVG